MKTTIHFLFLGCILLLNACVAPPSAPTQEGLDPTPSPLPAFTLVPLPTQISVPEPSPTVSPALTMWSGDFSHVLYGGKVYETTFFLLLGGVSRDAWLPPDESVARYAGEATYSLHSMTQEYKYFLWGKSPEFSPTCQTYSVSSEADPDESGFVTVLDGWDITKREVTELSADGELYRQSVTDWLASEGVDAPQVGSLQIFRVDIEGDGTDEVFISANHFREETGHMTEAGDYSVILMRRVVGNDVITLGIVQDVYSSQGPELTFPRTYSLANFIDLNQDGVLEVVVEIRGWEKFGAIVFQIDGQDVIQTLRAEC